MAEEKKKDEKKGEAPAPEEAAAAAPAKPGKKKLFMIVGGVFGLILAVGTPIMFMKMHAAKKDTELASQADLKDGDTAALEGSTQEDELQEGEEALGAIFPLDAFVVNLLGGRYIRTQVQIEFITRDVPQRFYARLIPVRDMVIKVLASHTADEMLSDKGKEGLKKEIMDNINVILKHEEVKNVYFTQFVVQ